MTPPTPATNPSTAPNVDQQQSALPACPTSTRNACTQTAQSPPGTSWAIFKKIKLLGSGTYGKCWEAYVRGSSEETRQHLAIKKAAASDREYPTEATTLSERNRRARVQACDQALAEKCIAKEVKCLKSATHKNLIQVLDVLFDSAGSMIGYSMPLAKGGTAAMLMETVDRDDKFEVPALGQCLIPIPIICDVMIQTAMACDALHSAGWIHMDLKADNILFAQKYCLSKFSRNFDGHVLLADAGMAKRMPKSGKIGKVPKEMGAWAFAAPELFPTVADKDRKVDLTKLDVFAMGKLLFQMVTLKNMGALDKQGRDVKGSTSFDREMYDWQRAMWYHVRKHNSPQTYLDVLKEHKNGMYGRLLKIAQIALDQDPCVRPNLQSFVKALTIIKEEDCRINKQCVVVSVAAQMGHFIKQKLSSNKTRQ
ncbi:hypothetical protein WJX73_003238 [Symbiochloris irregularis]|uniref:Protein kinase domain-containing protein n=1 Tax=Symbiochloris irregularis TaxID=706552 RepID=A0AAW1Q078_9CHLO